MKHHETNPIDRLLRAAHNNTDRPLLSAAWRTSVMADIARQSGQADTPSEFERLAPRFALAATAMSLALLVVAVQSFSGLSDTLYALYINQAFGVPTSLWASM